MKKVKEYDSPMTPEEVVARLKEKTEPVRFKLFPMGDWELRHHLDGTLEIKKDSSGKAVDAYASLRIFQTKQGSHLILEMGSSLVFDLFTALILFWVMPIIVYRSELDYGRGEAAIFGFGFMILVLLIAALWTWYEEKELIEFFESGILGIPKKK